MVLAPSDIDSAIHPCVAVILCPGSPGSRSAISKPVSYPCVYGRIIVSIDLDPVPVRANYRIVAMRPAPFRMIVVPGGSQIVREPILDVLAGRKCRHMETVVGVNMES